MRIFFLFALALLLFIAPALIQGYINFRHMPQYVYTVILVAFYCCVPAAATALLSLLTLLRTIRLEEAFSRRSSRLLRVISWCCVTVAVITFVVSFWYMPFFLVTGAMLFIFLIVRVVALCFTAATALKEENSLTI